MYYIRYPLSFRQVEDILHEREIGAWIKVEYLRPTPSQHMPITFEDQKS